MQLELESAAAQEGGKARARLLSRSGEPLFHALWDRALFLHYEVDPGALQRDVAFPLDLREGRAYVSLVAFTMRRMRFRFGGRLGEWLCKPIATHDFLNLRTYVRHRDEPGILFLTEWLSNRLCTGIGPWTYGLPYRYGRMNYQHRHEAGTFAGRVSVPGTAASLRYDAVCPDGWSPEVSLNGSLDEFLLERYTAFTVCRGRRRFFRIWHEPWLQTPVLAAVEDDSLIRGAWKWFADARWVGANYSPGARHVSMGWPHRVV